MSLIWYFLLFLVSGFCSLVYETIWLRLAMAKFGVTTPTVSIVLSVFMAGLAVGSWGGGLLAKRLDRSAAAPLRVYALMELIIGFSGLAVPPLLGFGHELLAGRAGSPAWNSWHFYLLSGGWIVVALLPWCSCMGATVPLGMMAIRRTVSGESRRSFSYLYLSNVVGATLGAIIPTLFLVEALGFRETLGIASAMNGLLAVTAFAISCGRLPDAEPTAAVAEDREVARLYGLPAGTALWLLFLTGLCSMAIEVVWIRLFTVFLGNVVYSFASILALYLMATYAGSQVYRWWGRSHDPQDTRLVWAVLAFLALLSLAFADPLFPFPKGAAWNIFRMGAGIAPFSGALGFLTPMLVDHFSSGRPDRAGRAYAMNVLGCVIGPLLAGFCILPWLGEHWGLVALALPLFAIGLATSFLGAPGLRMQRAALQDKAVYAGMVLLAVPLVAATRSYDVLLPQRVELRDHTATVIASGDGMRKKLYVNGIAMTFLTPITKVMAHLPLAFLSKPPRSGLVICFGMGTTFRSMRSWGIDTTAVELIPSVPKLFGYYHPDGPGLLRSSQARIVVDDGRRFLEQSAEQYDVITLDPPPPLSTPTSSLLFSTEFYAMAKRHLRPGGILQVWLVGPADPGSDAVTRAALVKSLEDSFPYIRAFGSIENFGFHLLASEEPLPQIDAQTLAARMPEAARKDLVEWGPLSTPQDMLAALLKQEQPLGSITAGQSRVPPIQDDQPINEYFFLRRVFGYYK